MPVPLMAYGIMAGASVLGSGVNAIMQWMGGKKQAEENARLNRMSIGEAGKERALSEKSLEHQMSMGQGQMRLAKEGMAFKKSEAVKDRKAAEEADKFNKTLGFIANFQGMLRNNPEAGNRLMSIQNSRRVA